MRVVCSVCWRSRTSAWMGLIIVCYSFEKNSRVGGLHRRAALSLLIRCASAIGRNYSFEAGRTTHPEGVPTRRDTVAFRVEAMSSTMRVPPR
jgi:hypothetical protein